MSCLMPWACRISTKSGKLRVEWPTVNILVNDQGSPNLSCSSPGSMSSAAGPRHLDAGSSRLGQAYRDSLSGIARPVFSFANMVDFFPNEFSGLCRRSLSSLFHSLGMLNRGFLRHSKSSPLQYVRIRSKKSQDRFCLSRTRNIARALSWPLCSAPDTVEASSATASPAKKTVFASARPSSTRAWPAPGPAWL
jgi:hypothetical protein